MIFLLTPFTTWVHAQTTDNGRAFTQHEQIFAERCTDLFAHPYASWERGAENMNGLIRQFFSKKMTFDSITPDDLEFATHCLNHRLRKYVGFKMSYEVFLNQPLSCHNAVALLT
jgi:transposase, IS30 family